MSIVVLSAASTIYQPQSHASPSGPPTDASTSITSGAAPAADGGAAAPEGLEDFYGQHLSWSDCPDGPAGLQCATAAVPVDYNDPSGRTVPIALKRLPASDGEAELGSLFLNPGGPGEPGTSMAADAASIYTPEMLAAYDIIGFDPRGTGESAGLTCWSPEELEQARDDEQAASPNGRPAGEDGTPGIDQDDAPTGAQAAQADGDGADDWDSIVASGEAVAAKCRQYSQIPDLIDHMSTRDTARDLDVLRAAVGDGKLSYIGYSYGTLIGATYAELFPANVGRTALDSAEDPDLTRSEVVAGQAERRENRMREYIEYCLGQEDCPLTGDVDGARDQLSSFVTGLDAEPLTVTQDGRSTRMDASTAQITMENLWLARPEYWPALTRALSQAMSRHDGTELARVGALAPGTGRIQTDGSEDSLRFVVAHAAVTCADSPDVPDPAQWRATAAADSAAYPFLSRFGTSSSRIDAYCHGWGVTSDTEPSQIHASGAAPILVAGVTGDSQTPYSWSQSLASQLDSGHLLTVEGYQHGASWGTNSCALSRVSAYLVNGTVPQEGTTCSIDPLPEDIAKALAG